MTDNILAALAEREEQLSEVSQASAELHRRLAERDEQIAAREAEIAQLRVTLCPIPVNEDDEEAVGDLIRRRVGSRQIHRFKSDDAAHSACLTQVREEMPEVEKLRAAWHLTLQEWSKDPDHPQFPAVTGQIRIFLDAIDTLQQNEARWRNARDVWEADRKRLRDELDRTSSALTHVRHTWHDTEAQLSASNAACAEMREALQEAMGWNWLDDDMPAEVFERCNSALASGGRQAAGAKP